MKQIVLSTGEWLLVKIPAKAKDIVLINEGKSISWYYVDKIYGAFSESKNLPPGQWKIIGKPLELSEEICIEIIGENEKVGYGGRTKWVDWKGGIEDWQLLPDTAKQSLLSLVEAEGFKAEECLILKKII